MYVLYVIYIHYVIFIFPLITFQQLIASSLLNETLFSFKFWNSTKKILNVMQKKKTEKLKDFFFLIFEDKRERRDLLCTVTHASKRSILGIYLCVLGCPRVVGCVYVYVCECVCMWVRNLDDIKVDLIQKKERKHAPTTTTTTTTSKIFTYFIPKKS